jgi:Sulfotransferase domain
VIIGASRSGTTSLARYLGAHPEVYLAREKELYFFNRRFHRDVGWYRDRFRDAGDARAIGEATPEYLYSPEAPARMARVIPQARLIAILRNPVDRAYSAYWANRSLGREPASSFEAAVESGSDEYMDRSRYLPHLERFVEHFPRSALHVMVFEELVDDPVAEYASVCRFLGVADDHRPSNLGRAINPYRSYRSLPVRMWARRRKGIVGRFVGRLNVRRRSSYPPMSPELRRALLASFEEHDEALAAWLGRNLSVWRR